MGAPEEKKEVADAPEEQKEEEHTPVQNIEETGVASAEERVFA